MGNEVLAATKRAEFITYLLSAETKTPCRQCILKRLQEDNKKKENGKEKIQRCKTVREKTAGSQNQFKPLAEIAFLSRGGCWGSGHAAVYELRRTKYGEQSILQNTEHCDVGM